MFFKKNTVLTFKLRIVQLTFSLAKNDVKFWLNFIITKSYYLTFLQTDAAKTVTLTCDCFDVIGPIKKVKDCEWKWADDNVCPEVPIDEQVDIFFN